MNTLLIHYYLFQAIHFKLSSANGINFSGFNVLTVRTQPTPLLKVTGTWHFSHIVFRARYSCLLHYVFHIVYWLSNIALFPLFQNNTFHAAVIRLRYWMDNSFRSYFSDALLNCGHRSGCLKFISDVWHHRHHLMPNKQQISATAIMIPQCKPCHISHITHPEYTAIFNRLHSRKTGRWFHRWSICYSQVHLLIFGSGKIWGVLGECNGSAIFIFCGCGYIERYPSEKKSPLITTNTTARSPPNLFENCYLHR